MSENDVVFTSYVKERDITITLFEGSANTFGRAHIIHRRPSMKDKINAVKYAVENADVCYWDEVHRESDREKIYCYGADQSRPDMYMKVIVEYTSEKEGTIITAWPQKRISPNEGVVTYVKPKK